MSYLIPTVIEKTNPANAHTTSIRAFSRTASSFLGGPIDDDVANIVIAQLLFLQSEDPKKDISPLHQFPRRLVTAGLAIVDTMNHIKNDVSTVCVGMAASMGAVILSAGEKGKRFRFRTRRS